MLDIFAGFDILAAGAIVGSLLLLGGLIKVLIDNRSFDEVNRRHAAAQEQAARGSKATPTGADGRPRTRSPGTDDGSPSRPSRPKRAA